MNASKRYLNVVTSIFMVITLILVMLSGFVKFVVTDKNIYLNLLENSSTYSIIEQALTAKMSRILGSGISDELKKSIITEDDIRKEANVVLDCVISDLISGQPNEPEIDTSVYKQRMADVLKTLTGYKVEVNNDNKLTNNNNINDYYICPINVIKKNDMMLNDSELYFAEYLEGGIAEDIVFQNLATKAELEAQGRAMLKEKGITEEEARQKAAERGISEEDVWNYLEQNGYLDEESETNDSESSLTEDILPETNNENESKNTDSDSKPENSSDNGDTRVSKEKIQEIIKEAFTDKNKTMDEKMELISSKLMEEAEKIIETEIGKFNLSKVISSNYFKAAIKATSFMYNNFYLLTMLFIIACGLAFLINRESFIDGFGVVMKAAAICGAFEILIFGSMYLFKLYENIDVGLNKDYFQSMYLETAQYFFKILSIESIIVLIVGLIGNIFVMKRKYTRR